MLSYLLDAATGTGANQSSSYIVLAVILVFFVLMFVFSSRSQKKRQQKMQDMINSLKVGNKIRTIGGIYGVIVEVCEDGHFIIETGLPSCPSTIKIDKGAIHATDEIAQETVPAETVKAEDDTASEENKENK